MSTDLRVCLGFDTSATGAGALVARAGGGDIVVMLREVRFDTAEGDAALRALFARARQYAALPGQALVTVTCEEPQGNDARGRAIRRATDRVQGDLRGWARDYGLAFPGVIAPATAKKKLAGDGCAGKAAMVRMACLRFRLVDEEITEHMADALGVALAGLDGAYVNHQPKAKRRRLPAHIRRLIEQQEGRS